MVILALYSYMNLLSRSYEVQAIGINIDRYQFRCP